MMKKLFLIAFFLLTPSAQAQEPTQIQAPATYDEYYRFATTVDYEARTISADKLLSLMKNPQVVIADLRSKEAYDSQHIKGAVHLGPDVTIEALEALAPSKETTIVLYCENSLMLTRRISQTNLALPQVLYFGYNNVFMLENASHEDMTGFFRMEETLAK